MERAIGLKVENRPLGEKSFKLVNICNSVLYNEVLIRLLMLTQNGKRVGSDGHIKFV